MAPSLSNLQNNKIVRYAETAVGALAVFNGGQNLLAARTQSAAANIISNSGTTNNQATTPVITAKQLAIAGTVKLAVGGLLLYLGLKK